MEQLKLGNITVDVVQKNIKNLHLSVYPPTGRVRVSAPNRMDLAAIRVFAISKLSWIKKQQTRLRNQEREAQREFINRESHYFNGKRYLLKVTEIDAAPKVVLKHSAIEFYVRPEADAVKRKSVLDEWYRRKLKETVPSLIEKWEKKINVQINEIKIKRMKTKWGTCNRQAKRIWLNLELAKKPAECLEYILVHEMVHLLERNHNDRFIALITGYMPKWRFHKDELNRLPVTHVDWNCSQLD
jgi:predicted metal-dependent hydrolase